MIRTRTRGTLALLFFSASAVAVTAQQTSPSSGATILAPGDPSLTVPEFEAYEVEYTSAFGRFFNQVRTFDQEGARKISVLNLIEMPTAVIVDHSIVDATTLRQENGSTPYFAWGPEFMVYRASASDYDVVRVPLDGGAPTHLSGTFEHAGFFDGLGFSPSYAAFLPRAVGTRLRIPRLAPRRDGTIAVDLVNIEVIAKESIDTPAGVSCDCTVLEETTEGGPTHRYWVALKAPFLFKRHRDVGGERDFVSEALSFRRW